MSKTTYYALFNMNPARCENCGDYPGTDEIIRKLDAESIEDAKIEALAEYDADSDDKNVAKVDIEALGDIASIRILAVVEEHDLHFEIAAKVEALKAKFAAMRKAKKRAKLEKIKRELESDDVEASAAFPKEPS